MKACYYCGGHYGCPECNKPKPEPETKPELFHGHCDKHGIWHNEFERGCPDCRRMKG